MDASAMITTPDALSAGVAKATTAATDRSVALALLSKLSTWFHWSGAALLAIMMVIVCSDAVARVAFNAPFAGTTEIVAGLVVIVTSLQLPYVLIRGLLLRVTFVLEWLPNSVSRLLDALAYLVGFAYFAAIAAVSAHPLVNSIIKGEFEGTINFPIPVWPLRLVTFGLWALSAIVCLALVADAMWRVRSGAGALAHEETLA
jgi:TRAP-type C4-dicarboxylate transport system permease small subunit